MTSSLPPQAQPGGDTQVRPPFRVIGELGGGVTFLSKCVRKSRSVGTPRRHSPGRAGASPAGKPRASAHGAGFLTRGSSDPGVCNSSLRTAEPSGRLAGGLSRSPRYSCELSRPEEQTPRSCGLCRAPGSPRGAERQAWLRAGPAGVREGSRARVTGVSRLAARR